MRKGPVATGPFFGLLRPARGAIGASVGKFRSAPTDPNCPDILTILLQIHN
jgi:hypothetical protein